MMGNHDPDIFWPKVQAEICQLLSPSNQERLQFVRTFIRRGTTHIEHGNQQCSPENEFEDSERVFHRCVQDREFRLELIWGTRFVMEFFNGIERESPFADNLKPEYRTLWLGIKNGWVGGREAAKFVKFLWGAGIPWSAVVAHTLSDEERSPSRLIQEITDQALARELLELYDGDVSFRKEFEHEMAHTARTEWRAINSIAHQRKVSLDELTPREEIVSPTLGLFRENPEFRSARSLLKETGVQEVVFGHTHMEIDGNQHGAEVPNYFNTGTWSNRLDISRKENRNRLKKLSKEDLIDDNLFELRLMYILVEINQDHQSYVSLRELTSGRCP